MLSKSEWNTKNVIYCYTNKINGKRYVGQTSRTLKTRHNQHVKSSYNEKSNDYNVPFHSAIRKYGIDNFELEILHIVDEYSIDMTEIFYIEYFDTLAKNGKGYNVALGGQGNPFAGYTLEQLYELALRNSNRQTKNAYVGKAFKSTKYNSDSKSFSGECIYYKDSITLKKLGFSVQGIKGAINGRNGGSYLCQKWELVTEEEYNEAKKTKYKMC